MASETLDAKGLVCPLPVLRANKALKKLVNGDILEIHATDTGAPKDFVSFCESTGDELLESSEENGIFIIRIRRNR